MTFNRNDWRKIAYINDAACNLSYNPLVIKSKECSKITKARAYCNLSRYYSDTIECKNILKQSILLQKKIENLLANGPKEFINNSYPAFEVEFKKVRPFIKKKGIIFLCFHFGAFEFLPPMISEVTKETVYIIVDSLSLSRQLRIEFYINLLQKYYKEAKIEFIIVQDSSSIIKLLRILKNCGIIIIYIDENKSLSSTKDRFVSVPFFNGHIYNFRTSLTFLLTKTDSIPFTILSMVNGSNYVTSIEKITKPDKDENQESIFKTIIQILEKNIRAFPYQWTRWYCIDELDELRFSLPPEEIEESLDDDAIEINDRILNKKYKINRKYMLIRKMNATE